MALVAKPSLAVAPIIVLLGKHLLQDVVMSTFRGLLIDQLSGLGCQSRSVIAINSSGSVKAGVSGLLAA